MYKSDEFNSVRITLCRILVLDEATSSLDNSKEQKIQKMLLELLHQSTIITVAHRLSNILDYDR